MPRLLWAIVALSIAAACGGSDPKITVQYVQPSPTPVATLGQPTPTPEPVEVTLSAEQIRQGGAILVYVTGPVASGNVTFRGRVLPLTQGDHSMYTFVGIDAEDPPGLSVLSLDFGLDNGSNGEFSTEVHVVETQWPVDEVAFTEDQEALLGPETVTIEVEALAAIYSVVTPEKLWSTPWQFPVLGALTAPFGEQRAVNGGPPSGHHTGADLGAEENTDVVAANSGRVAMAGALPIRGNTVIIDHGGGLFTTYGHLSAITVTEGQEVEGGDVLGRVGNTGLSTGAHLHWEMAAGGVRVDPVRFADGTNGF